MHQHRFSRPHPGAGHQRRIASRRGDKQSCGVAETPALGDAADVVFLDADLGCEGALGRAEHARADGVETPPGAGEDEAGEFGARDPREGGLALVLAADLEGVVEVAGGGVDGD